MIDDEVRRLMGDAYKCALDILETNRDIVKRLTEVLLEKETVSSGEIRQMLSEMRPGEEFPGLDALEVEETPEEPEDKVGTVGPEED